MTTEVQSATDAAKDVEMPATSRLQPQAASMVERVASVISGVTAIGHARNLLQSAGWVATIAANRITVDGAVEAHFIPAHVGNFGEIDATWIVSSIAGTNPVWIVGTKEA